LTPFYPTVNLVFHPPDIFLPCLALSVIKQGQLCRNNTLTGKQPDGETRMYTASDLRKGLKIMMDGSPYIITVFDFSKPGKGQALYKCKMRNLINGNSTERTFRSNDKFEPAPLEERPMQYLYSQGDEFHFMDNNSYEQLAMTREQLGDNANFLIDNMEVSVLFFNVTPIDITLPIFVNLTVTQADPWVKGDTSGSDTKPVTVETGYVLQVPPFIEEGDRIQIDTRTGEYITRVKE